MQLIRKYRRKTGFSMLRIVWQGPRALQILRFVGHAYMYTTHHVLSAHAHNPTQYVGKGRQQAASFLTTDICSDINAAARGVCAL